MHEYSIVQSLLELCEQNAKQNDAKKISKVTIKVGKLSGVEPHLLEVAFDTFKDDTICSDATLEMLIQDLVVECRSCLEKSTLKSYVFLCPKCQSQDIKVIDGEEMFLMSLELE